MGTLGSSAGRLASRESAGGLYRGFVGGTMLVFGLQDGVKVLGRGV